MRGTSLRLVLTVFLLSSSLSCKKTSLNSELLGYGGGTGDGGGSSNESNFPSACLSLDPGEICTLVGPTDVGNGKKPAESPLDLLVRTKTPTIDDLGNLIFFDYENYLIWYWNRTAATVTRFGQTIDAGQAKIIAGNGAPTFSGANGDTGLLVSIPLVSDMVFNPITGELYFASSMQNGIRALRSDGTITFLMGGGASHIDGEFSINHQCWNPSSLALDLTNQFLYVSCTSNHRIKRISLNAVGGPTAISFAGNGSATSTADGGPFSGSPVLSPLALAVHPQGLLISEPLSGSALASRLRFLNTSGADVLLAGVTITNGTIKTLNSSLAASCTSSASSASSFRNTRISSIFNLSSGIAYFDTHCTGGGLYYLNNTGSPTFGGVAISNGQIARINAATAGNIYGGSLTTTRIETALISRTITFDSTRNEFLVVSTRNSAYAEDRLLTLSLNDDKSSLLLQTSAGKARFSSETNLPVRSVTATRIGGVHYDDSSQRLYFTELEGYRVRSISSEGKVTTAFGSGYWSAGPFISVPLSAYTPSNRTYSEIEQTGLASFNGSVIVANALGHTIGVANLGTSVSNLLGVNVPASLVTDVAGSTAPGNVTSGPVFGLAAFNSPSGIDVSTSGEIYVADSGNHCIKRINSLGEVDLSIGSCGTYAPTTNDETIANARFYSPEAVLILPNDNLIVTDTNYHKIKYINRSASNVMIGSLNIAPGRVVTIACDNGFAGSISEGIAATSQKCDMPTGLVYIPERNWICFANGGNLTTSMSNVRCLDLASGIASTVAGQSLSVSTLYPKSMIDSSQEGIVGTSARLKNPKSLAWDGQYLYIADMGNAAIRKLRLPDSL